MTWGRVSANSPCHTQFVDRLPSPPCRGSPHFLHGIVCFGPSTSSSLRARLRAMCPTISCRFEASRRCWQRRFRLSLRLVTARARRWHFRLIGIDPLGARSDLRLCWRPGQDRIERAHESPFKCVPTKHPRSDSSACIRSARARPCGQGCEYSGTSLQGQNRGVGLGGPDHAAARRLRRQLWRPVCATPLTVARNILGGSVNRFAERLQ